MLKEILKELVAGKELSTKAAEEAMLSIMEGQATGAQIGALLVALRMRGETGAEILGFAKAMRQKALPIAYQGELADTCGTGGDGANTFNISTTCAFVVAACGIPVAKHGNRAISSRSGSADLLKALGIKLELAPAAVTTCIEKTGIGFLYAPSFHSAMKHASGARADLGMRTVFNLLGPLTNPLAPSYQAMGIWDPELVPVMGEVLLELGAQGALVFHGAGLDELTLEGENVIAELEDGKLKHYRLEAKELGLAPAPKSALLGGSAQENAEITIKILQGERGPRRDVVLLNTAALLKAAGRADSWQEGIARAGKAIDSGEALARLEAFRTLSREVGADAVSNCQ